jgi:hypothetical protein
MRSFCFYFLPTKTLTSASTTMNMAASAPCELMRVPRGKLEVLAARLPMPSDPRASARAARSQHACSIDPTRSLQAARLGGPWTGWGAFATSSVKVLFRLVLALAL